MQGNRKRLSIIKEKQFCFSVEEGVKSREGAGCGEGGGRGGGGSGFKEFMFHQECFGRGFLQCDQNNIVCYRPHYLFDKRN